MNSEIRTAKRDYWWILLTFAVLFVTTSVFYSTGAIILSFSAVAILLVGYRVNKEIKIELLLCISLCLMFLNTQDVFSGNERWKLPLVSTFMLIAFHQILIKRKKEQSEIKLSYSVKKIADFLYYIVWIWGMYEILRFIVLSLKDWENRRVNYIYPFEMHYVDFTFVLLFIFNFGIKTRHYFTTIFLTLISVAVFPARMYTFYIVLFCCIYLFHQQIRKILNTFRMNDYFKIIMLFAVAVTILSLIWTFVFVKVFEVADTHQGYFDDSNQLRFMTVVYALQIIRKYKLIFKGMPSMSWFEYGQIIQSPLATDDGPHNSYVMMILYYGVFFSIMYCFLLSKIFNKSSSRVNDAIIVSYLMCAGILHLTLEGYRLFLILVIVMMPDWYFEDKLYSIKFRFGRLIRRKSEKRGIVA